MRPHVGGVAGFVRSGQFEQYMMMHSNVAGIDDMMMLDEMMAALPSSSSQEESRRPAWRVY